MLPYLPYQSEHTSPHNMENTTELLSLRAKVKPRKFPFASSGRYDKVIKIPQKEIKVLQ